MSWPYALLTLEKQYETDITTSVSAQRPLISSKRHANNTGTAAYATKPVPTYFSITLQAANAIAVNCNLANGDET